MGWIKILISSHSQQKKTIAPVYPFDRHIYVTGNKSTITVYMIEGAVDKVIGILNESIPLQYQPQTGLTITDISSDENTPQENWNPESKGVVRMMFQCEDGGVVLMSGAVLKSINIIRTMIENSYGTIPLEVEKFFEEFAGCSKFFDGGMTPASKAWRDLKIKSDVLPPLLQPVGPNPFGSEVVDGIHLAWQYIPYH